MDAEGCAVSQGLTVMRGDRRRMRRNASSRRESASLSPVGAYAANSATKRWHASFDASRGSTRGPSSASQAASASSAGPCHVCAHHTPPSLRPSARRMRKDYLICCLHYWAGKSRVFHPPPRAPRSRPAKRQSCWMHPW